MNNHAQIIRAEHKPPSGFLTESFNRFQRLPKKPREYSSQREFEADWVRNFRKKHGLSQLALAGHLDVTPQTVLNWENPGSKKWIAAHNQERFRLLERQLWVDHNVTELRGPLPISAAAVLSLVRHCDDDTAQKLGEHLLAEMTADHQDRALLHHIVAVSYRLQDEVSPKAREHIQMAMDALKPDHIHLRVALMNASLRFEWVDVQYLYSGPSRIQNGEVVLRKAEELFSLDPQPTYLWNALEVACITPLPDAEVRRIVERLQEKVGAAIVRKNILADRNYARALDFTETN